MRSNIFEVANARDMHTDVIAEEFIWTSAFDRLFSKKNHIILGSRGTGKTALIKMLSFDGLSQVNNEPAKRHVSQKSIIATFLPLRAEFTTKLESIENNVNIQSLFFVWSINLASCNQFLITVRHCIDRYMITSLDKIRAESELSEKLGLAWFDKRFDSLRALTAYISKIEYEKNFTFNKVAFGFELSAEDYSIGEKFHSDLFVPFKKGIDILKECIKFKPSTIWSLCIDEAEILNESQWIQLNTKMRTFSDITFKITTMPYKHNSLETLTGQKLNVKHDFEYIYLDRLGTLDLPQKEAEKVIKNFALKLFENRIQNSTQKDQGITLESLLGKSDLTDNSSKVLTKKQLMIQIEKYCTPATVERATSLYNRNPNSFTFSDQIERPLRPLLILKEYFESATGQGFISPKIYSGFDVAIKCCDGNPRKLINLFNRLFTPSSKIIGFKPLTQSQQGRILKSFSNSELETIMAGKDGHMASELIMTVGNYFKVALHSQKIGIHVNTSFEFDTHDKKTWGYIMEAVDLGLLIPDIKGGIDNDSMPLMSGTFQMAGCLAPNFQLLPRKGETLKLSTIKKRISASSIRRFSFEDIKQMGLWDE